MPDSVKLARSSTIVNRENGGILDLKRLSLVYRYQLVPMEQQNRLRLSLEDRRLLLEALKTYAMTLPSPTKKSKPKDMNHHFAISRLAQRIIDPSAGPRTRDSTYLI